MKEHCEHLLEWVELLQQYQPIEEEKLPDIDLYMDQVITFITRQLDVFIDEDEKLITPSMINNYTKNDIIARPLNKKYDRSHLTSILMMCVFKQILPIKDVGMLLGNQTPEDIFTMYEAFIRMQKQKVDHASARMSQAIEACEENKFEEEMTRIAMEMIIEANVLSTCAKKILHECNQTNPKSDKAEKQKKRQPS